MDAKFYVYAYLLLSVVYAAACLQYLGAAGRARTLTRGLGQGAQATPAGLDPEASLEVSRSAIRTVVGLDSAAFACAVLPIAYIGVSGLLANFVSRNTGAAAGLNLMWLVATVALVGGHMFFLARMATLNSRLKSLDVAALSPAFVTRKVRMLDYYRAVVLLVTVFNVVNTVWLTVNIAKVTRLPFVM